MDTEAETQPPDSGESGDSSDSSVETGDSQPDTGPDTGPDPVGCVAQQNPGPLEGATCVASAPCVWAGEQTYEYMGWSVAAGDLDGDGLGDLLMGSPTYDATSDDGTGIDAGRVQLVSGASMGLADPSVMVELTGGDYAEQLGSGLALAGDVNGDGQLDLLIGAQGSDGVATNTGVAYLLLGPSTDWSSGAIKDNAAGSFLGESESARVGLNMAGGGDANGDGRADLLLAAAYANIDGDYDRGRVHLFWGE